MQSAGEPACGIAGTRRRALPKFHHHLRSPTLLRPATACPCARPQTYKITHVRVSQLITWEVPLITIGAEPLTFDALDTHQMSALVKPDPGAGMLGALGSFMPCFGKKRSWNVRPRVEQPIRSLQPAALAAFRYLSTPERVARLRAGAEPPSPLALSLPIADGDG